MEIASFEARSLFLPRTVDYHQIVVPALMLIRSECYRIKKATVSAHVSSFNAYSNRVFTLITSPHAHELLSTAINVISTTILNYEKLKPVLCL